MTLTLSRRPNLPGMTSVAILPATPVAIDNMDAIKIHNHKNKQQLKNANSKHASFRTLGETAALSEESSTASLSHDELEDAAVSEEDIEPSPKPCFKPLVSSTKSSRRRSSILKPCSEEIPINLKGKPFKSLPPPDMSKIQSASVTTATSQDQPTRRKRHNVGFSTIEIREYNQTIGDNPSVSYGPPISLDWEYNVLETITLEHYEAHRAPRRSLRQMCLNYYTRRNVLTFKFGYSEQEVKAASKLADKSKRERAVTKYFLPYAKVEDFVTSAGRKAKRGFKKSETV